MTRKLTCLPIDFNEAIRASNRFASKVGFVSTRTINAGKLYVPSGRIVVADPGWFNFSTCPPFRRRIKPGSYPVRTCLAKLDKSDERVACAMLHFSSAKPTRFSLATTKGQNLADLKVGEFFGVGVDTGTACFIDQELLVRQSEEVSQANADDIAGQMETDPVGLHAKLSLGAKKGNGLIAFASGHGDGAYPVYWGYDRNGEACCLVVDFGVLIENDETELQFRSIIKKADKELRNDALASAGISVHVSHPSSTRLDVTIRSKPHSPSVYAYLDVPGERCDTSYEHLQGETVNRFKTRRKLGDSARLFITIDRGIRALTPA